MTNAGHEISIPLAEVELDEREIEAVAAVLRSRWLTMAGTCARFEEALARRCGTPHALAVANCTAALHLACLALEIGPGDEVLVPSLSFVASANVVRMAGATPVFVDCIGEDDFNIDPADLARRITARTKAIVVVHYGGYACAMDEVLRLADARGLPVIEDCAHAPGGTYGGRPLGSLGRVGCFSFFGNKNITTGEGGAVVTGDAALAEKLRLLRSHGMTTLTWDRHRGHAASYDVVVPGLNYRLDEMRAALGLVQLERLADNNARRGRVVRWYRAALAGIPGLVVPFRTRDESTFHLCPVLLAEGADRAAVMGRLREAGIQTSIHYPPTHLFTAYRGDGATLPRVEALAPRILTLPLYPRMSEADVATVAGALAAALRRA